MELRDSDSEKLVLTKEDVQTLYSQLNMVLIIPKKELPIKANQLAFLQKLWRICSIVSTVNDFEEEKDEFKRTNTNDRV